MSMTTTKTTTIHEALQEIKTIGKRIDTKRQFVSENLMRPEALKDPLERQGGSAPLIASERQSIDDLWRQQVAIRRAIDDVNIANTITIGDDTRSMAEWLVWRREVAPERRKFLQALSQLIATQRREAQRRGSTVVSGAQEAKSTDIVVNINEKALMDEIEQMETVLGALDGQLSLKNATLTISY